MVDVWTINLDREGRNILSDSESQRAARFHFEHDRRRWTNARSALRSVLALYLKTDPTLVQIVYGTHDKPLLEAGPHFNISHSGAWAMIAVSQAAPVGIDIERIREDVEMAKLLHRIGEPAEIASASREELFQLWARREAKNKALGIPLMKIPEGNVCLVNLRAPAGFSAALAQVGAEPAVAYRNGNEHNFTEY